MSSRILRGICGLLCAVWVLWPGAGYPEDWRPVSVDDKGKGVYIDRDRALHIGSFVTLFMRETLLPDELVRQGGLQRDIALRIDCGKPEAQVAYGELLFKDGRTVRFYGESQADQYAKPAVIPFIEASLFASLQQGLCALPGEKLVEIARDGEDVRTQVNITSVVRKGEEVRAWVRFDYPVVALGLPFRNPYGSKRQLMYFRCASSEYAAVAGLSFDDDEVISDGGVFPQPSYEKVDDTASAEVLRLLCESSEDLQRLAVPQLARAKPKVWEMPLDPVPAEAPAALKDTLGRAAGGERALQLRIRRAVIETIATTPDGQKRNSLEERTFQSRGDGLVLTSAMAPEYSFEDLSLYGLITVGSRSSYPTGGGASRKLEHITFSGTLVSTTAGGAVAYELAYVGIDTVAGRSQSRSRTECKLGAVQPATKLNGKLTGDAIPVDCETALQGGPSSKMRGWLLLDAGWYFQEMFETDYYRGESRLVEVEGN